MLKLVIQDDQDRRTSVPLVRDAITIGRSEENTIRLTERNVSRSHARLVREDDKVYLEDLSRYGVRKNGARVRERTAFQFGDVVVIGDYRLFLKKEAAAAVDEEFASSDTMPHIPSAGAAAGSGDQRMPHGALLASSHELRGEAFAFSDQNILVVGRGDTVDLRVEHSSISKRHALLRRDAAGHILEDLNSANGIFVNGEKVSTAFLRHGDALRFGELGLLYAAPGEALPPLPDDDDALAFARGGGPPLKLVVSGVVLLLVVAGVLFLVTRPSGETPDTVADDAMLAALDTPAPAPDLSAEALAEGQRALGEGRWADAMASFDEVEEASDHRELAESLRRRAENEAEREGTWRELNARMNLGIYDEALELLQDIPVGTYYHTRAVTEQVEQRLLESLVEQAIETSIDAESAGDLREARAVIDSARAWTPNNERLRQRLRELDSRRAERAPEPAAQRTPEPAREVRRPEPAAVRTPERRPAREAAPEPPSPPPAEPEAPPEPAFNPVERANQLKMEARQVIITGDRRTAIRQLEEARRLNPGDAEINLMLYQNYRGVGNNRQAAAAIERYMRQRPDDRRPEYVEFVEEHRR